MGRGNNKRHRPEHNGNTRSGKNNGSRGRNQNTHNRRGGNRNNRRDDGSCSSDYSYSDSYSDASSSYYSDGSSYYSDDSYNGMQDDVVMGYDHGPTMTFNIGGGLPPMTYHFDPREAGDMVFIPPGSSYVDEMTGGRNGGRCGGGNSNTTTSNSHRARDGNNRPSRHEVLDALVPSMQNGTNRLVQQHYSTHAVPPPHATLGAARVPPGVMLAAANAAATAFAPAAPKDIKAYDPLFDSECVTMANITVNNDNSDADSDDNEGYRQEEESNSSSSNSDNSSNSSSDSDEDEDDEVRCASPSKSSLPPTYTQEERTAYNAYLHRKDVQSCRTENSDAIEPVMEKRFPELAEPYGSVSFGECWQMYKALIKGQRWPDDDDCSHDRTTCCYDRYCRKFKEPPSRRIMPTGRQLHDKDSCDWDLSTRDGRKGAMNCLNAPHEQLRALAWLVDEARMKSSGVLSRLELKCLPCNWASPTPSSPTPPTGANTNNSTNNNPATSHAKIAADLKGVQVTAGLLSNMIIMRAPMRQMDGRHFVRYVLPAYEKVSAELRRRISAGQLQMNQNNSKNNSSNNTSGSKKQQSAMTDDELMKETLVLLVLFRLQCTTPQWARYHVERYCAQYRTYGPPSIATGASSSPTSKGCGAGRKRDRETTARNGSSNQHHQQQQRLSIVYDGHAIAANFSVFLRVLHDELAAKLMADRRKLEGDLAGKQKATSGRGGGRGRGGGNSNNTNTQNQMIIAQIKQQLRTVRAEMAHLHRVTLLYYGADCCCDTISKYAGGNNANGGTGGRAANNTNRNGSQQQHATAIRGRGAAQQQQSSQRGGSGNNTPQVGPYHPSKVSCFTNLRKLEDFERYFS